MKNFNMSPCATRKVSDSLKNLSSHKAERIFWSRMVAFLIITCSALTTYSQCGNMNIVSDYYTRCMPAQFKLTIQNMPAGSTVAWEFGSGVQYGSDTMYALIDKAGKITVNVKITDPNGAICTMTKTDFVEVYSNPIPEFTISRNTICNGSDSITFFDISPNSVKRTWVLEGKYYFNSPAKFNYTFKSAGLKTVALVVEDAKGCVGIKEFDNVVTVYPQPAIDFTADFVNGCVPKTINITPAINMFGAVVSSYTWTFDGGQPYLQTTETPSPVLYNNAGIFSPSLQIKTQGGCTYNLVKTNYLTFGTGVVLNMRISDSAICMGETVTIENVDKSLPGDFYWNIAGNPSLSKPDKYTNYAVYNTVGKYDVALSYNHNGCQASQSISGAVRVKGVTAAFISKDNFHCKFPHVIHLTNQSVAYEPGTMSYYWHIYNGGTLIHSSTNKDDSFVMTGEGMYDVMLTTTHSNGCHHTYTMRNFIKNKKMTPQFDALYNIGCVNQPIQFIQSTSEASYLANNKYKWTFYGKDTTVILGTSNDANPKFAYPDTGFYHVKLFADNGIGCSGSLLKMRFIEIVKPRIDFIMPRPVICKNDTLIAAGNSGPAHVKFKYSWHLTNTADGSKIYKDSASLYQVLKTAGQYNFKFVHQISDGCRDSIVNNNLVYSNGINANINLDTANGCLPFNVNPTLTITENVHYGSADNTVRYQWSAIPSYGVTVSNGITANPTFVFNQAGEYKIQVMATNNVNCTVTLISKTINAGVKADFSASDLTVCIDQSILLSDSSRLKPTSIKWILNSNTVTKDPLIQKNINVNFLTDGYQRIGLVAGKYGKCYDTMYQYVRSIVVVSQLEGLQTVMKCAPVYAKFVSRSKNADTLFWDFGDGNKLTTTDSLAANIYKRNTGSQQGFTVTLIAKSKEGCSDTMVRPDYMKIIGPVPKFSIKNFEGCEPLQVEFIDSSKDILRFYIDYGDSTANDSISFKHTYIIKNNVDYKTFIPKMYASDAAACVASYESPDTVKVKASTKSVFTVSDSIICLNEQIKIVNYSTRYTNSDFYFVDGSTRVLIITDTFTPVQKGAFQLWHVVKNSQDCYDSSMYPIIVNPNPVADFTMTDTLCLYKPVHFNNISTSDNPIATYDWEIKNPAVPVLFTTNDVTYTFNTAGAATVSLTVIDTNNCRDTNINGYNLIDPVTIPSGEIKVVSVNNDNSVNILSEPSTYYRFLSNQFYYKDNIIKTSLSKNGSGFSSVLPANIDSVCVDMTTTDVCLYESSKSIKHCTIFLQVASNKPYTNQLTWTPYKGWPFISIYQVFRKADSDSNYSLVNTLSDGVYSWLDSGLCNTTYSYYIAASYKDIMSKSNRVKSTPIFIFPVAFSDIKSVSVVAPNAVEVKWNPSTNQILSHYTIYRTALPSGLKKIYRIATPSFIDYSTNTDTANYIYHVAEIDLCNNSSKPLLDGITILLEGYSTNYKSVLYWNTYHTWATGVSTYNLQLDNNGRFINVSTNVTDTTFVHTQQNHPIRGPYCYRIEAISGNAADTSYSNVLCLISPSTLFFPNAFTPNADGLNEKIGAKSLFIYNNTPISGKNFSLAIFSLSGEMLFHSTDIDQEWNGMYLGKPVQSGVYIYYLRAVGVDGKTYALKGDITILD